MNLGDWTMNNIIQNLSGHPFAVGVIILWHFCFIFLFKQSQMALLFFMIILALCGYFYFKDSKRCRKYKETLESQVQTGKMWRREGCLQTGREVVEKGKKLTEGWIISSLEKKKTDKIPERGHSAGLTITVNLHGLTGHAETQSSQPYIFRVEYHFHGLHIKGQASLAKGRTGTAITHLSMFWLTLFDNGST